MLLIGRDAPAVSCLTGVIWLGCHVQHSLRRARIGATVTHAQASLHHVSALVSLFGRQVVNAVHTASETQRECIWEWTHAWWCLWVEESIGESVCVCVWKSAVVFYLKIGIVCVNRPFPGIIKSDCVPLYLQCVTVLQTPCGGGKHFSTQIHSCHTTGTCTMNLNLLCITEPHWPHQPQICLWAFLQLWAHLALWTFRK